VKIGGTPRFVRVIRSFHDGMMDQVIDNGVVLSEKFGVSYTYCLVHSLRLLDIEMHFKTVVVMCCQKECVCLSGGGAV